MGLKKTIGSKALMFLTLNAIIGTGIFFLPTVGASIAGPASIIAWVIMGAIALVMSFCFAEMVSLYPRSGGIYEYARKSFGEFPSFIVGWVSWLVANVTIAMLIVGSLLYLLPGASFVVNITLSLIIVLIFNYVNYRGVNYSAKLLVFFGLATVIALLVIIFPGFLQISGANFDPFFIFPPMSIFLAVYFISETFFGWESACYLAEEVKNVRRVLPRTLVRATAIIALLSLALVFVSVGSVGWSSFAAQSAPLSFLSSVFFGSDISRIFSILIFIPLIGTAAGWIVSSPRLLFAMSRDRVLPRSFSKIHERYNTPHKAIAFQTIVTIFVVVIGFANYFLILSLLLPLVVIMYSAFLITFIELRLKRKKKGGKEYYRAPFSVHVPAFVFIFNIWLLFVWLMEQGSMSLFSLNLFLIFMGIPLYLIIKLQTDQKFVARFYNAISFTWDTMFPIWYGKKEVERVMNNASVKRGDKVLDFGCGTGITTLATAERVGDGAIVAVDISDRQIEKAFRKMKKAMALSNVVFVKEHELKFEKKSFDVILAVGVLEHLDKPKVKIKKILSYLKKGGTFSFLSFGRSFTLPASEHISSYEKIAELFSSFNVDLRIMKEQKKFTDYWYIWGKKK